MLLAVSMAPEHGGVQSQTYLISLSKCMRVPSAINIACSLLARWKASETLADEKEIPPPPPEGLCRNA